MAWFFVYRILVPKVKFATKISEIGERPRLRLKVRNAGYRDILDCEVMAEFRVRGLDRELPKNISVSTFRFMHLDFLAFHAHTTD